ncbi:MAG: hypothetical protein RR203_02475 [Synergistaceae bacterium]
MATKKKNYDIGSCYAFFKPAGGAEEIKLGHTNGGIAVKVSTETMEIEVDQLMDPIDEIVTKRSITISVPLVDFTLENLQMAFCGSELVVDKTDTTKKKLVISSVAGKSARDGAGELRLHPVTATSDTDKSKDFFFPAAAPVSSDLEISYTKDGLKTIPLEFKAYPSEEVSYDGVSLVIGDPTATAEA